MITKTSNALGKHWKIKDTSKMHHTAWNKDKKLSDEIKRKMSEAKKDKPSNSKGKHWKLSEEYRIKMSKRQKGKPKWTEEQKKKMSETKKGRKSPKTSGEKNGNWKDGRMSNKDYVSWSKNKRNRMPKIGGHTWEEWELLKKQYGNTCPNCHKPEPEIKLTEDHIIPLSKGGSDNIENIQPLCRSCNAKKYTKIIKY